jgi:hypothetical protein
MGKTPERGSRKFSATREHSMLVVLAFLIAAWLKVGPEMFGIAVLGITGNLGLFSWGNTKVHGAQVAAGGAPAANGSA